MEILQLSILGLQERIEQELWENPILEVGEVDPDFPDEQGEPATRAATTTDVKELVVDDFERLTKLKPSSDSDVNSTFVPKVMPDVWVARDEDGKWAVKLEDGRTPTLRISLYYRVRLEAGTATPEEKEFIKRKMNAAQWLIEAIEQRRNTLTKVTTAIIEHQHRFLEEDPEAIEPLKMQQIADKVGAHVTTVSRAVDDKWIQTPHGLYPLKRFLVGYTTSDDGEEIA